MPGNAFAVLLRGVNLGQHNKVSMPDLRSALTDGGFSSVTTLLQSGNVAVTADGNCEAVAHKVSTVITDAFHLDIPCIAVDRKRLDIVMSRCPLLDVATDPKRLIAIVVSKPITPAMIKAFDPRQLDPDNARIGDSVVYQWCPDGSSNAPQLLQRMERKWSVTATARNWNTMTKLAAMLREASG